MDIFNITNNEVIKAGDTFYINFKNIFLLTLHYFPTDSEKNIKIKKFEILVNYTIFLNIYKSNILDLGNFTGFNPLKYIEEYGKLSSKKKFEREILKKCNINPFLDVRTIFNFINSLKRKNNKVSNKSKYLSSCYSTVSSLNNLIHSTFKIESKYVFRENNIILFNKSISKKREKALSNLNNYLEIDDEKRIIDNISETYNYTGHFNCCGFSYLTIRTENYKLNEKEELLINNYSREGSQDNLKKIKQEVINNISNKIIKLFSIFLLTNHKSIILDLLYFNIYFKDISYSNSSLHFHIEELLNRDSTLKNEIIKKINSDFRSKIISNDKLLIQI